MIVMNGETLWSPAPQPMDDDDDDDDDDILGWFTTNKICIFLTGHPLNLFILVIKSYLQNMKKKKRKV